jgi:CRP/FNR family transcriptional regulator, dissimilatory nitrate respiration regulator
MENLSNLLPRLRSVAHFRGLSDTAIKEIVFAGQMLRFSKDEIIFNEGADPAGMYVILQGQVRLCKLGLQGQETIISIVKPVIMFNEVTVIDGQPNPVSAIPDRKCLLWHLNYDRYQFLFQRYPELGTGLLRVMAARNRQLLSHYENLISRSVLARTAKEILTLSQFGEIPINRHTYSNQQIAARAATVHEAVSRSIKKLHALGVIEYSRGEITVTNPTELANLAQVTPIILQNE